MRGLGGLWRMVGIAALLMLAAWCTLAAWGGLRNLFADYQDSPAYVYVIFGGFWLMIAAFFGFVAIRLSRRR